MARPCFPFPPVGYLSGAVRTDHTVNGVLWDGTTFTSIADEVNFPVGSSAGEPICGPGTYYPIGMTLKQLEKFWYSVRLWKISFSGEEVFVPAEGPDIVYSINVGMPAVSGGEIAASEGAVDSTYEVVDLYGSLAAAGAAGGPNVIAHIDSYYYVATPTPDFNTTPNFTGTELNALYSYVQEGDDPIDYVTHLYYNAGLGSPCLILCEGLYYPLIFFITTGGRAFRNDFFQYIQSVNFTNILYDELPVLSENISLIFGDESFSIPVYYSDPGDSAFTLSGSIEAIKYWPYKDAAGTALYDEDTGEPV